MIKSLLNSSRLFLNRLGFSRRTSTFAALESTDFASGSGNTSWLLYGLCRFMKPKVCVEIGSARGKSACYVGMALKENGQGHLYAIDPHARTQWNDERSEDTHAIISGNVRRLGLEKVVTVVRKTSSDALADWTEKIDILFIDGDHQYEGVKADWEGFRPHMQDFGIVVFHDTLWEVMPDPPWRREDMGVPRFVEELRRAGYPVVTSDRDFGVSIVQPRPTGIALMKEKPAGDSHSERAMSAQR